MKLSDIRGEHALELAADLIDPIANIAADPAMTALLRPDAASPETLPLRLRRHLPALLRAHKEDVIVILAAIQGVTPADYSASLDMVRLIKDLTDLLTDEGFDILFSSAPGRMDGDILPCAPENTTGPAA